MAKIEYIESDIPQKEQKHQGWFWFYPTKAFYRWSDLLELCKQYDEKNYGNSN